MDAPQVAIKREPHYPLFLLTRTTSSTREPDFYKTVAGYNQDAEVSLPVSMTWHELSNKCKPYSPEQFGPVLMARDLDDYLGYWEFDKEQAAKCADNMGRLKLVAQEVSPYKETHQAIVELSQNRLESAANILQLLNNQTPPLRCLQAKIRYWQGNTTQAIGIFKELVNENHLTSFPLLALAEHSPTKSIRLHFALVCQAAEGGQRRAQYLVGDDLKTDPKAEHWLERAACQGSIDGAYELGAFRVKKGRAEEGVKWLEVAHGAGNSEATCLLAACTLHGVGTKKDQQRAVQLFELAVEKGSDKAKWNLALCCMKGWGRYQDEARAYELYKQVLCTRPGSESKLYLTLGLRNVIWRTDYDNACKADRDDALELHKVGSCYGHASGFYGRAEHLVLFEKSNEQNLRDAQDLFNEAHKRGHPTAERYLEKRHRKDY